MASPMQPVTAQDALALTKSDTTVYRRMFSALYVGTGGDVTIRTAQGNNVTFPDVPSGAILPITGDQLLSTGTDASGIVAMYY
jgi:hypothetical protein